MIRPGHWLDGEDHEPRLYCVPDETSWRGAATCPICGDPGTPGRAGHEPDGWPVTTVTPAAVTPTTRRTL